MIVDLREDERVHIMLGSLLECSLELTERRRTLESNAKFPNRSTLLERM